MRRVITSTVAWVALVGCGDPSRGVAGGGAGTAFGSEGDEDADGSAAGSADEGDDAAVLDVGSPQDGGNEQCFVVDEMDAPAPCQEHAPPESFDPAIQWSWSGEDGEIDAFVIPLVANLTDDNGDGSVDLCDVPDVVVVATAGGGGFPPGYVHVLAGDDGHMQLRIPTAVDSWVTPALGDIDGDGDIEIVSVTEAGEFVAFDSGDGAVQWMSAPLWDEPWGGAIALADLEGDGNAEILADNLVVSHTGELLWSVPGGALALSATTAADLDGQPGLEVITSSGAYRADGTTLFELASIVGAFPQVANMDEDPEPEVLYTGQRGISLYEADGTPIFEDLKPMGSSGVAGEYQRPAAIHDFDGDGWPEFASSSAGSFAVLRRDGTVLWQTSIEDVSGLAGGTGFDFLGDGTAEAMIGDEVDTHVFASDGTQLLSVPRASGTLLEYPVVADIDNDGSAEIVVVNHRSASGNIKPTIEVIRDADDRWIGARRIWNQHTYHVTNVREDGSIPTHEAPSWQHLNTFRTNAQVQDGGVCMPVPAG